MNWAAHLAGIVAGCLLSGVITWWIVSHNRKTIERNERIRAKNDLLRDVERRGLYLWGGAKADKDFNLDLETAHILSAVNVINDRCKELGAVRGNALHPELLVLLDVIFPGDLEVLFKSPEDIPMERAAKTSADIKNLVAVLQSIPPK